MTGPRAPNPMQELLRREMGIDAFALDGDATELGEQWNERPRLRVPQL